MRRGGDGPPPPHAGTCQSAAPPPLRCALQGSWLQVRLWGVGCCSEGRVGALRPRPRAVDRFLGSQYVKYVSAACSPPPPSSSPLLHGGDMRAPLVAASAGIAPPVSAVELVPPGVGVDAATWGKGPRESSGGVMGRGGEPRCLALQFCLPACLMSFPSYVPRGFEIARRPLTQWRGALALPFPRPNSRREAPCRRREGWAWGGACRFTGWTPLPSHTVCGFVNDTFPVKWALPLAALLEGPLSVDVRGGRGVAAAEGVAASSLPSKLSPAPLPLPSFECTCGLTCADSPPAGSWTCRALQVMQTPMNGV